MKRIVNYLQPRWLKVFADLWKSKTRTILVVASIAVGVFAIGAIATAFAIMSVDFDISYQSVNPANIEIPAIFTKFVYCHMLTMPFPKCMGKIVKVHVIDDI